MGLIYLDVESVEARVKVAPDAEALKAIVAEIGVLPGSQATLYSAQELMEHIDAQELMEHIDAALREPALVKCVTRTLGLRAKVIELLAQPTRS